MESGTVCCRCQFHCIACVAICDCGPKQRCARLATVGLCFACYFDLLFKGPGIVSWVADKIASRIITSWLYNVVGSFFNFICEESVAVCSVSFLCFDTKIFPAPNQPNISSPVLVMSAIMFLIVFECSVVFIHFDFSRIGYTRFVSLKPEILKRFFCTLHSKNLKDVVFPFSCFTASLLIAQGFPPDNPGRKYGRFIGSSRSHKRDENMMRLV